MRKARRLDRRTRRQVVEDVLDDTPLPMSQVNNLNAALANRALVGHHHAISDVDGLQTSLDAKSNVGHGHAWGEISGKPSTYPPSTHQHSYSDLADKPTPAASALGQVTIAEGGLLSLRLAGKVQQEKDLAGAVAGERYLPFCRSYRLNGGSSIWLWTACVHSVRFAV